MWYLKKTRTFSRIRIHAITHAINVYVSFMNMNTYSQTQTYLSSHLLYIPSVTYTYSRARAYTRTRVHKHLLHSHSLVIILFNLLLIIFRFQITNFLILWKSGKCLLWDVTIIDTMVSTYIYQSSHLAGPQCCKLGFYKQNLTNAIIYWTNTFGVLVTIVEETFGRVDT